MQITNTPTVKKEYCLAISSSSSSSSSSKRNDGAKNKLRRFWMMGILYHMILVPAGISQPWSPKDDCIHMGGSTVAK